METQDPHPITSSTVLRDLRAAVRATSGELVQLLSTVQNPAARAIGDWSIEDLAAHLTDVYESYPRYIRNEGRLFDRPADITAHNAAVVEAGKGTDVKEAAQRIAAAARELDELLAHADPTSVVRWHGGAELPMTTLAAIPGSEAIVHGYDIASAEDRSFQPDRSHAALVLANLLHLLPLYVNEQAAARTTATYDLRLKGGGRRFLTFEAATLEVSETGGRPDCVVLADAATFLLIGYNRIGQWRPALTGKVVAWGRKPWLALRLPKLIATI